MENQHYRSLSGYHYYASVLNCRISKGEYITLRNYATAHGISLADFRDFTGNIQDMLDIIDKISIVSKDFPKITDCQRHVILGLRYEDSEDFAGTESNKIILNGMFYNDVEITAKEYEEKMQQGFFVKGTTWKDIIFHELGHVVSNLYHLKPLEIAQKILHTKLKTEVAEYVAQNLSLYSAKSYESIISHQMEFDGSEIIAECFCAYYGGIHNEFAISFVNACKEIIRR